MPLVSSAAARSLLRIADLRVDPKLDEICKQAEDKMKALIQSEKPNSDLLFDLTLKTTEDLEKDLAEALGLDLVKCSADQKKLVKEMAAKAMAQVKATSPNTMSANKVKTTSKKGEEFETAEEITLNGTKYKNPSFLGQGGHVKQDLPKLVAAAQKDHVGVTIRLEPAIGEQPSVIEAIAAAIAGSA